MPPVKRHGRTSQDNNWTQSLSDTLKEICPEPYAIDDLNDFPYRKAQISLDRILPPSIVTALEPKEPQVYLVSRIVKN